MYHISPINNRENILTNGINPDIKIKRYSGISENATYLWEYLNLALWYAYTESRDYSITFDIYEVEVDESYLTNDTSIGIPYSYKYSKNINPNNLKLIKTIKPVGSIPSNLSDIDDILMDIEDNLQ